MVFHKFPSSDGTSRISSSIIHISELQPGWGIRRQSDTDPFGIRIMMISGCLIGIYRIQAYRSRSGCKCLGLVGGALKTEGLCLRDEGSSSFLGYAAVEALWIGIVIIWGMAFGGFWAGCVLFHVLPGSTDDP